MRKLKEVVQEEVQQLIDDKEKFIRVRMMDQEKIIYGMTASQVVDWHKEFLGLDLLNDKGEPYSLKSKKSILAQFRENMRSYYESEFNSLPIDMSVGEALKEKKLPCSAHAEEQERIEEETSIQLDPEIKEGDYVKILQEGSNGSKTEYVGSMGAMVGNVYKVKDAYVIDGDLTISVEGSLWKFLAKDVEKTDPIEIIPTPVEDADKLKEVVAEDMANLDPASRKLIEQAKRDGNLKLYQGSSPATMNTVEMRYSSKRDLVTKVEKVTGVIIACIPFLFSEETLKRKATAALFKYGKFDDVTVVRGSID